MAAQTADGQLESAFRAGQQDLRRQQFARAVDEFKQVLALDPSLVEAQVNLGLAYQGLFEYDLAASALSKALAQRPNLVGPTVIAGMDYLKLGAPERAIPYLKRALEMDRSNRDAQEALAAAYLAQDDFLNAAQQFERLAALDPDKADAWFKLGHQYLDLAARLAFRAAHLYPESAWGHRFLGDLLAQRSRWKDAIDEYNKALGIEPQQPGLHAALGESHLRAGDLPDAEKEFRLELQRDAAFEPAFLGLAQVELLRTEGQAALAWIGRISLEFLAAQRDFPAIEIRSDAAKSMIAVLQSSPEGAGKRFLLAALSDGEARSFEGEEKTAAAPNPCSAHQYLRCVQTLRRREHLTDTDLLLLGKAHLTLRQYEPAAAAFARVTGVTAANAEASYWLSHTYQAQGAVAYVRLQENFPNSWRAHQLRAEGLAFREDVEGAVKEFHAALELRPSEPGLHAALGQLYLEHAGEADAERELQQAFTLDPLRTQTLSLLGRLYLAERENEKAASFLERAVRLRPDFTEASSLLGTTYVRLGKMADAIPRLEKAAPFDHYGNVHYELYQAYRKLGESELAKKALQRSRDLHRTSLQQDQAKIMGSN